MADAPVRRRISTPLLAVVLCIVWSSAFIFVELALRDAPAEISTAQRALAAIPVLLAALLVAGMAGLVLGERLTRRQVVGLFVGWAGIALAVLGELSGADPGPRVWQAALLFLAAAVCFAVGTVVVKAVTTGPGAVPLPPALLLGFVYGSLPLIAFATTADEPVRWTGSLVISIFYAGVVSLAGGYLLQFALLERGDAGVVSSYIFAVPILAAVYGVVIFDERLSAALVVGAVAVAAAILLVTVPARPRVLEETP